MKTAMQFSGGRDSLVALMLLEPFWDGITVVWCDSGDSAPELHAVMRRVEALVPHFARVEGCAPDRRKRLGDPTADAWLDCCYDSIWIPMMTWVKENKVRFLIRGTRKVDPIAWPTPNTQHEGIKFLMPLWDWSDEILLRALAEIKRDHGLEPVYPHDCLTCPVVRPCDRPELRNVA